MNLPALAGVLYVTMRTILASVLLLAAATTARADENVSGSYDVKFEETASNCTPPPVTMGRGKVVIEIKKQSLTVNIELIPQLVGIPAKGGKIKAATTKVVATTVQGLDGKYTVGGRVENGILGLVLVAEYINHETKKPYCTQSWNLSGVPSTDKPDKKTSMYVDFLPLVATR
jgi:hypothetical protein